MIANYSTGKLNYNQKSHFKSVFNFRNNQCTHEQLDNEFLELLSIHNGDIDATINDYIFLHQSHIKENRCYGKLISVVRTSYIPLVRGEFSVKSWAYVSGVAADLNFCEKFRERITPLIKNKINKT